MLHTCFFTVFPCPSVVRILRILRILHVLCVVCVLRVLCVLLTRRTRRLLHTLRNLRNCKRVVVFDTRAFFRAICAFFVRKNIFGLCRRRRRFLPTWVGLGFPLCLTAHPFHCLGVLHVCRGVDRRLRRETVCDKTGDCFRPLRRRTSILHLFRNFCWVITSPNDLRGNAGEQGAVQTRGGAPPTLCVTSAVGKCLRVYTGRL